MIKSTKAILEKVILINFNSFQNDEVPLSNGLTIITGPNGAGKSTIFQGIKFSLSSNERDGRAKKWSDFIRIGENFGSVELHIRTGKKLFKIRRIIQKGKTPYFQFQDSSEDKSKIKFKNTSVTKIQRIVTELGYNPDNVFAFVSQGNITNIKNMETKQICDFFELGLGLKELKEEIIGQKEKITEMENKIKSLDSIKDSASYELELLKPKLIRLKAKQKLLKIKEKLDKESLYLNRSNLKREVEKLKTEIEEANLNKEIVKKKKENLQVAIDVLENSLTSLKKDYDTTTESIIQKTIEEKSVSEKIEEWQQGKDDKANMILEFRKKINDYKSDLQIIEKDYDLIEREIDKYQFELEVVNQTHKNLMEEFKKNEELRKKYQNITGEFDELKKKTSDIKLDYDKNRLKIENLEENIENNMDLIKQLRQELDKDKWFIVDPDKYSHESLEKQRNKIRLGLEKLELMIKNKEFENKHLEKKLEELKSSVLMKELPKSRAMENLIKEIKARNLDVIGPIIDLIDFDPRIGPAVDSILNKFVLNSFITKSKNDFLLVHDLIKQSGMKCNVYQPFKIEIKPLPPIQKDKDLGIYGYLTDFIKTIKHEDSVKKVIYSICRDTVLVKDKGIGYDFINIYGHRGRVVALDGTVIRTYKYVMESRSSEKTRDYKNPLEQKRKLEHMSSEIRENRTSLNELEKKKLKIGAAYTTVQARLRNINSLHFNFRKLTIIINKKNRLISSKRDLVEIKNNLGRKLNILKTQITDLKTRLPTNFEDIDEFFLAFKQKSEDIDEKSEKLNSTIIDKEKEKHNYEMKLLLIKQKLDESIKNIEEMEAEFNENDSKILEMIKLVSELKDEISKLKEKRRDIQEKQKSIIISIKNEDDRLKETKDEISRIAINIENIFAQIYQKKKILNEIKVNIAELGDNYQERTIEEVNNDLNVIIEKLRRYYDVSDELLKKNEELKEKILKISQKKRDLNTEIEEASKAEKLLEVEFFKKFNKNLRRIENNINTRFEDVGINRKGKFNLIGDFDDLGIEILVNFNNDVERKISSLSGGEQTMFAISLMLTLQELNPSPMCIFDEAQMFLDNENSDEVAKLIKNVTKKGIQFVMILPDASKTILKLADSVIGIAKNGETDVSTVIEIPKFKAIINTP
jgi:chromosome segregation protein